MPKLINICDILRQYYHTKIDHLAIGTEKIISFSENKFITLTIQSHIHQLMSKDSQRRRLVGTWVLDVTRIKYQRTPKIIFHNLNLLAKQPFNKGPDMVTNKYIFSFASCLNFIEKTFILHKSIAGRFCNLRPSSYLLLVTWFASH